MYCNGVFIYKGLKKRAGGTFKNSEGKEINYDDCYILKVDEINDGEVTERNFKFPTKFKDMAEKIEDLDIYTKIKIAFEVVINTNSCKLVPVDISTNIEKSTEE